MVGEPAVGRYQPEMIGPQTVEWIPVPDLQPVLDADDLETERLAHKLRSIIAERNARLQPDSGVVYRVRYVPPA
jgi:hypothetical protein